MSYWSYDAEVVIVSESHFRFLTDSIEDVDENSYVLLFCTSDCMSTTSIFTQIVSNARKFYKPLIRSSVSHTSDRKKIILSRVNMSNLGVKKDGLNKMCPLRDLEFDSVVFSPQFARSATIALLETYVNIDLSLTDECLKNYFRTTRYVCDSDLISIDTKKYVPEIFVRGMHPEKLYFKVRSLDGQPYDASDTNGITCGYLIDLEHSTVHQESSMSSFISRHDFQCSIHSANCDYPNIPDGLNSVAEQIEQIMLPSLRTKVESTNVFLITGRSGVGKSVLLSSLAAKHGLRYFSENCLSIQNSNAIQTEKVISNILIKVSNVLPCLLHFRHVEGLCRDESGNNDDRTVDFFVKRIRLNTSDLPLLVFCTSHSQEDLIPALKRIFLQSFHISSPNLDSRSALLKWIFTKKQIKYDELCVDEIARATPNFIYDDLVQLISRALRISCRERGYKMCMHLSKHDVDLALKEMTVAHADSLGAPEIPTVTWDDIGGFFGLKKEILSSLYASTSSTLRRSGTLRLFLFGFKHRLIPGGVETHIIGVLLYGPPGTGKTILAKAIATECKYNFLSVKGPELLNMYVGQSEKNVREVFAKARECVPCIIFFDEFDSLAPRRGQNGGSGSVMDRVVSQLLAEMDGIQNNSEIFVLAATNRHDLIDSALLRPGRLDKILFVDGCNDVVSRMSILRAVTRKFNVSSDVNFEALVKKIPVSKKITGADLYGLSSQAWLNAARRTIRLNEKTEFFDGKVDVLHEDFISAFSYFDNY